MPGGENERLAVLFAADPIVTKQMLNHRLLSAKCFELQEKGLCILNSYYNYVEIGMKINPPHYQSFPNNS